MIVAGLTTEAMLYRLLATMSVVACGIFDGDVVMACDGAAFVPGSSRREDAMKVAPLNSDWAIGFFGNTLFLNMIAPCLWGLYQNVNGGDVCAAVFRAGKTVWRTDLVGDAAIDVVDTVVRRYASELLPHTPDTVVFLAGMSSRGPEIYEWSAYDGMTKRKATEEYGFIHRVAVPGGGVAPCRALCNKAIPLEDRLRQMLKLFSNYTTVNENLAVIRHSTGWTLEGRDLVTS